MADPSQSQGPSRVGRTGTRRVWTDTTSPDPREGRLSGLRRHGTGPQALLGNRCSAASTSASPPIRSAARPTPAAAPTGAQNGRHRTGRGRVDQAGEDPGGGGPRRGMQPQGQGRVAGIGAKPCPWCGRPCAAGRSDTFHAEVLDMPSSHGR
ncbi:hypothetical protein GCM10007147_26850 [Nocardiopsis kunsanensis]|uniref:Uncharacterized protein n=1 Tax=Nocardiopsis kunsanensis TaxID=141693 RepID=A0A918XDI0_9ACTN|nr:hypothetical protein GCM10007147_26850 [Nocardiopsis kunsanensis]